MRTANTTHPNDVTVDDAIDGILTTRGSGWTTLACTLGLAALLAGFVIRSVPLMLAGVTATYLLSLGAWELHRRRVARLRDDTPPTA